MSSSIVLVGFMGTGKTCVGREIERLRGFHFLDMDMEIEKREGRDIPRIFRESGEPYFRGLERTMAVELGGQSGLVVATGGGVVLDSGNIGALGKAGAVVCLSASPETILERVEADVNRPLLAVEDRMGRIKSLLASRKLLYDAIPLQVATDGLTPEEVALRVLELFDMSENRTAPDIPGLSDNALQLMIL